MIGVVYIWIGYVDGCATEALVKMEGRKKSRGSGWIAAVFVVETAQGREGEHSATGRIRGRWWCTARSDSSNFGKGDPQLYILLFFLATASSIIHAE